MHAGKPKHLQTVTKLTNRSIEKVKDNYKKQIYLFKEDIIYQTTIEMQYTYRSNKSIHKHIHTGHT